MELDDLLPMILNDDEALLLLSILGFEARDWPTLSKLSSPQRLIASTMISEALAKLIEQQPAMHPTLKDLRALLDGFYEQGGSLWTIINASESRLFKAAKAPLLFFARFNRTVAHKTPALAIVGARAASEQGVKQSFALASSLASQGVNVISGGALGIDSAAHRGALHAGGTTVIISGLACTLKNDELGERVRESYAGQCAVIYPFGPLVPQGKYMFVERNRFVAAMADALVVVQGQKGSGTLHTVRDAKRLGLPIFAIPGALNDSLAVVPNMLIGSGEARALIDLQQKLSSFLPQLSPVSLKRPKSAAPSSLPKEAAQGTNLPALIQVLRSNGGALAMPELLAKTNKNFLELQKELLTYELQGLIVKRGPQFVLTDN